jgi:hypothetical protein
MVHARHQRHLIPPALHSISRERMGRYTQPRTRHRGLATLPPPIRPPSSPVGTPYYRPARFRAQHPALTIQRPVARPTVRGRRQLTPARRNLMAREQLLQPSMDRPAIPRRQAKPIASAGNRRRPLLAQQDVVPRHAAPRHHDRAFPNVTRPILSRQARHARGGRTTPFEASCLYTRRGAIGLALQPTQVCSTAPPIIPPRIGPPRYRMQMDSAKALWSSTMVETYQSLLGTDTLGVTAINMLRNSLAPSAYANCNSAMRQFFALCT